MKKVIAVLAIISLVAGCQRLGFDSGGVEVRVVYTDNLDHEYSVTVGPEGAIIYVSTAGNKFIEAGNGKLTLTDSEGNRIQVEKVGQSEGAE